MDQRRALLLVNGQSRQGDALRDTALMLLERMGWELAVPDFEWPAAIPPLIREHAPTVERIVLGGGDGTLNLAAAAILACSKPVAILPMGTANDFARTLGIPADLSAACRLAAAGVVYDIDLGQVNDRYFLNVASLGLAVRACEYRSVKAKRWFGALGYAANLYSAARDTRPFTARVTCDDGPAQTLHSIQIAVGNGRFFGGGIAVAEDAALDDDELDLYSLEPQSPLSLIRRLPALMRGPDGTMRGGHHMNGQQIRVETDLPMDINTDGEITTTTPAHFKVLSRALRVVVPEDSAAKTDRRGQPA